MGGEIMGKVADRQLGLCVNFKREFIFGMEDQKIGSRNIEVA